MVLLAIGEDLLLNSRDLLSTLHLLDTEVRNADMAHFSLLLQCGEGTPALFNIGIRIGPVDLIQVDDVNAEPFQTSFDFTPQRGGFEIMAHFPMLIPHQGTLGEYIGPLAPLDSLAYHGFRVAQAIDRGGIDPVDTHIQRAPDR